MKTLKEYLSEMKDNGEATTKFVAIIYDDATQKNLQRYCEQNGFDISKNYDGEEQSPDDFEFHTTVFYTITEHKLKNGIKTLDKPLEVTPTELEFLGEMFDVPVLKVESEDLLHIRRHYQLKYDMQDAWPDYKPHISLSYNRENLPDIERMPLPDFPLIFDKLKIADGSE